MRIIRHQRGCRGILEACTATHKYCSGFVFAWSAREEKLRYC